MTATIPAGQSLSSAIDCGTGAPVFLHMPDEWTPSRLTFQVSADGTNFKNLFNDSAQEIAFNIRAGTSVLLNPSWTPVLWLKMRSGSCDLAVPQADDREIVITIDTSAAV